jgi:hypothetical protein
MANLLKIEIGDTVRISESSKYYMHQDYDNPRCEGVCIKARGNWDCRVIWSNGKINSYNMGDLILIKKGKTMKEFTKSDLKTGMFVKQREGMYMLVLEDRAVGNTGFTLLSDVRHNLLASVYKHLDIVAVYRPSGVGVMTGYMSGNDLNLIWERTEQTPSQIEMEVLQSKMDELQEQMKVVQAKL